VKLIVSFTPGGGADLTARTLGAKMSESLKQPVVVENRPGANGLVGAGAVAQAAPDGYTILLTDRGALGVNPSLYKTLPYDPLRDFAYIGVATVAPYVLVSNPRLKLTSLGDLVQYAKANPGKLNYASFGIASMAHLNLENFKAVLGVELVHVPYKGAGPAVQAVVAGEAAVTISSPAAVLGFVRDGRLHAIAIGAPRRSALLPNVPTLDESGLKGYEASTFIGVVAPAGIPPAVMKRLNEATRKVMASNEVTEKFRTLGTEPGASSPEEFRKLIIEELEKWREVVRKANLKFD